MRMLDSKDPFSLRFDIFVRMLISTEEDMTAFAVRAIVHPLGSGRTGEPGWIWRKPAAFCVPARRKGAGRLLKAGALANHVKP